MEYEFSILFSMQIIDFKTKELPGVGQKRIVYVFVQKVVFLIFEKGTVNLDHLVDVEKSNMKLG